VKRFGWVRLAMRMRTGPRIMESSSSHLTNLGISDVGSTSCRKLKGMILMFIVQCWGKN
jgi:hypothetical protein